MQIAAMTTDQIADVLIQIAPDVEILVNDTEISKMWKERDVSTDLDEAAKMGIGNILRIGKYLLETHRGSTWNILGAFNQKTAEEIGQQSGIETLKQLTGLLSDKDFLSFFPSFKRSEQVTQ